MNTDGWFMRTWMGGLDEHGWVVYADMDGWFG